MTLLEQHKKWMERDRKADAVSKFQECPCEECGCIGNNRCGHECLGQDCALDDMMMCPCCNIFFADTKARNGGIK